jgi:hypothetical protein
MKHNHSSQQIAPELRLKISRLACRVDGNVTQIRSARLVDFFQAVDQRSSLNRCSSGVVGHPGIGFDYLRNDIEPKAHHIA